MKKHLENVRTMSENTLDIKVIVSILRSIIEALEPSWEGLSQVERWEDLSRRLSDIAHKDPPWGWRYMQGVSVGKIDPSGKLTRAIQAFAASLDGLRAEIGYAKAVTVYAAPGMVKPGSLVLAASRPCHYIRCPIWFIPRTPNQKYHHPDCKAAYQREKVKP